MNPFQNVSFDSVEECLDFLPEQERRIAEHLRRIILETLPEATEKLSYNVPYYARHSNICFIWPAAVPWGKIKREGVMLGFTKGHLLTDESDYLEAGSRKQVRTKTFFSLKEIDEDLVRAFLFEALDLDKKRK